MRGPDDEEQNVGARGRRLTALGRPGGLRQRVYSNSLLLVMGAIFLLSW